MAGRDPGEGHRASTSLELLFDLTFAIAFGQAGASVAHLVVDAQWGAAAVGFAFSMFAICWAWINFTWFASAYDTDDWAMRLATMLQMVGVLILATGIPTMFHSLVEPQHEFGAGVMVFGYVVMRVAMVIHWLRALRDDPARRRTIMQYIVTIVVAQVGWCAMIVVHPSIRTAILVSIPLAAIELLGPWRAERVGGTPWHAGHIAERYSLLAIITLGECLIGTIASLGAQVDEAGWSFTAMGPAVAGTAITFGLWWIYSMLPSAELLERDRSTSFLWGYGHIPLFASIAATGAGLHVVASSIEGDAHISPMLAVACVVGPVFVFGHTLGMLYHRMVGPDSFHSRLHVVTTLLYAGALALAYAGVSVVLCLFVVVAALVILVVGDEWVGAHHRAAALALPGAGAGTGAGTGSGNGRGNGRGPASAR